MFALQFALLVIGLITGCAIAQQLRRRPSLGRERARAALGFGVGPVLSVSNMVNSPAPPDWVLLGTVLAVYLPVFIVILGARDGHSADPPPAGRGDDGCPAPGRGRCRRGGFVVTTASLPLARAALPVPRPVRWTCAEFHRFGDLGVFEGRRAMLIDGVILEEGPMNPPHAITLGLVEEAVRAAFGAGWWLRHQSPLVLGLDIDPEPDLAVVAGRPRDYAGHPSAADLVVEVSDSSLDFDTDRKRLLYARAGIAEYWVVDINGRRLLVYRAPQAGNYAAAQVFGPADAVSPLAVPSVVVRVADLLM